MVISWIGAVLPMSATKIGESCSQPENLAVASASVRRVA
jgi:hypothetical protein